MGTGVFSKSLGDFIGSQAHEPAAKNSTLLDMSKDWKPPNFTNAVLFDCHRRGGGMGTLGPLVEVRTLALGEFKWFAQGHRENTAELELKSEILIPILGSFHDI